MDTSRDTQLTRSAGTGQQFELSVGHKIKTSPFDSIRFAGQEGQGSFNASMELFQDETFSKEKSCFDR